MMNNTKLTYICVCAVLFSLSMGQATAQSIIDEFRLGASVVDLDIGNEPRAYKYDRAGLNGEVLFTPVNIDFLEWFEDTDSVILKQLLNPRVHLGTTIALESDATSSAYTGLTWHWPVGNTLFFEASFGGAVHNGELEYKHVGGGIYRRGLGSRILFRESASVGANLTENVDIVLQLSHMSHGGLAEGSNTGQTDLALKLGWKF